MSPFDIHTPFLQLLPLGIGLNEAVCLPKDIDWSAIQAIATQQGLSAVISGQH